MPGPFPAPLISLGKSPGDEVVPVTHPANMETILFLSYLENGFEDYLSLYYVKTVQTRYKTSQERALNVTKIYNFGKTKNLGLKTTLHITVTVLKLKM